MLSFIFKLNRSSTGSLNRQRFDLLPYVFSGLGVREGSVKSMDAMFNHLVQTTVGYGQT